MCNLKAFNEFSQRLNAVIAIAKVIEGDAPAVRTHNRIMRIQAISGHIISDVLPNIADVAARNAVYMWLDAINAITQIEEHEAQGVNHG
ncbi:hypothetical protein [Serratia sp. UGAL515B_01]|uniref:hypothetical protein n=1 Tax=Serratia sp. UGAL515B_01 TaxID=2986763 RepID=UPI002954DE85|nr:hypothetical protein [Serratia sp. UGAL515B_01]WON77027.1 hypothetical protein OK023_17960 [Serratia sp. UGAL515B_01]